MTFECYENRMDVEMILCIDWFPSNTRRCFDAHSISFESYGCQMDNVVCLRENKREEKTQNLTFDNWNIPESNEDIDKKDFHI